MRTFSALVILLIFASLLNADDSLPETGVVNGTALNDTSWAKENTFADMIDLALEKEFNEADDLSDVTDHGSFNNNVAEQQFWKLLPELSPRKMTPKMKSHFSFMMFLILIMRIDLKTRQP